VVENPLVRKPTEMKLHFNVSIRLLGQLSFLFQSDASFGRESGLQISYQCLVRTTFLSGPLSFTIMELLL
jgi:hypothetical protein